MLLDPGIQIYDLIRYRQGDSMCYMSAVPEKQKIMIGIPPYFELVGNIIAFLQAEINLLWEIFVDVKREACMERAGWGRRRGLFFCACGKDRHVCAKR